ncbi:hypothetical protein ACNVED_10605 [Legionella sp. D16C41]|uniref:hypothetical protein n=1 Tax=Legionella sp. D16C41 TaxID=3402688 RepID=UPI003AF4EE15
MKGLNTIVFSLIVFSPLATFAANIPTIVQGTQRFNMDMCIQNNKNDCVNANCLTSTDTDCIPKCANQAVDKCKLQALQEQ